MYTYKTPSSKRTLKDRLSINRRKKRSSPQPAPVVDQPFRLPLQRFLILPHEQQQIIGRMGTIITFPANAFVYSTGVSVFEEVEIELKEVMTKKDVVRENLTTTSGDALLESGGMLYLNASSGGENVYINDGIPIRIEMPRSQNQFLVGTELFTGQRNRDGVVNWQPSNTQIQGQAKARNMLMRRLTGKRDAQNKGTSKEIFEAFLLETTELGWMNCDRYFDIRKEDITTFYIDTEVDAVVEMKVVLKDYNSVLPVYKRGGQYLAVVPHSKAATLTGFYQKGDQYFFGAKQIVPGQEDRTQLNLEEKTLTEIKKQLRKL